MDGQIDYAKYTLHELRDAVASIDRARFPVNYARLQEQLNSRGESANAVQLASLPTPQPDPVRSSLRVPARLVWATIPLSIVVTILEWDYAVSKYSPFVIVEVQLLTIAITAWLLYFMARGRNWARVTILVLTALGMPFYLVALIGTFFRSPLVGIICVVQILLTATAIYMVFSEPARREFRRSLAT